MGTNKRKHTRFDIHQAITLEFGHERYIDCDGINISEGGMLVETTRPMNIYDRLFLMFSLPETDMITIEAIVMRAEKKGKIYKLALQIADIKPEDKRRLKKYMRNLEK